LNFWDELNLKYEEKILDLKNSLAYGNASSYDEYRHTVGVVEGVEWAKECLKHIVKQRIYEEEDTN
tara:strand:+ start:217 stop:414 length:198 start_codon:yes stop_codon:yes gene_type:complete